MSLIIENFSGQREISVAKASVIRTLIYFDIFHHPLKAKEIFQLSQNKELSEAEIEIALNELGEEGLVQYHNGFYLLNNNPPIVKRRLEGEQNAEKSLRTAKRFSNLIAKFPFVRGIALSGSLSKNYMDDNSDIDYFIITATGRMWVARTLLVIFKKTFLLNSRKYFCVNYFLSEDSLEVPDKNIFTATEVSFLIPTYNYSLYKDFMHSNGWAKTLLPNFPLRDEGNLISEKKFILKSFLEKFLSERIGEKLDGYFFRVTLKFWKKKFKHLDESTFDFRLRSKKNVSKHHPQGFQEKVLSKYSENISAFNRTHNVSLHVGDSVYA